MSSDKDVIGKADGLMRRHAVGSDTGSVPVLTEMVAPGAPVAPSNLPHNDLAREIFARVMSEVETRLAADLEKRLNQHLVPQVHAAVANAIGDLHQELANVIAEAVSRALEHHRNNLK